MLPGVVTRAYFFLRRMTLRWMDNQEIVGNKGSLGKFVFDVSACPSAFTHIRGSKISANIACGLPSRSFLGVFCLTVRHDWALSLQRISSSHPFRGVPFCVRHRRDTRSVMRCIDSDPDLVAAIKAKAEEDPICSKHMAAG